MLWLWIGIIQYELDSRGTTPLNSNTKKREGKTFASFWQRRFPFWRKIKPLILVLLTTYFSPAMKTVYFLTFKIFGFLLSFHTVFTAMCVVVSVVYAMFLNHEHLWCTKYWFSDTGSLLIISTMRQYLKVLYFFSRHQCLTSTHRHLFFKFIYCSTRRKSFVLCYTSFTRIQELPPTLQPSLIWNEMCTWWPWSHVKSNVPFMGHFKHVILSRR